MNILLQCPQWKSWSSQNTRVRKHRSAVIASTNKTTVVDRPTARWWLAQVDLHSGRWSVSLVPPSPLRCRPNGTMSRSSITSMHHSIESAQPISEHAPAAYWHVAAIKKRPRPAAMLSNNEQGSNWRRQATTTVLAPHHSTAAAVDNTNNTSYMRRYCMAVRNCHRSLRKKTKLFRIEWGVSCCPS